MSEEACLSVVLAGVADAAGVAALRTATAADLTARFGAGPWSMPATGRGVLWHLRQGDVLVAREAGRIVGTLALARRKPLAIDPAFFTRAKRPLYLVSMAVAPDRQGRGVGRVLMAAAADRARRRRGDAIRLDAYQGEAGAGRFYVKCGYAERGRVVWRDARLIYFETML